MSPEFHKNEKKWKYLEACLQQRRHFPALFISIYGLPGGEVEATLKLLSSRLTTRWKYT